MFGLDDARRKIEAILEGKEDEKLFGGEDKEGKEENTVTVKETEEKEMTKEKKKEWYGIHVSDTVPNKTNIKYVGVVYVGKTIGTDLFENDINGESVQELLELLKNQAIKKGANAIISLRFGSGTYEGFVKSWNRIYQYAYGEAVIVE